MIVHLNCRPDRDEEEISYTDREYSHNQSSNTERIPEPLENWDAAEEESTPSKEVSKSNEKHKVDTSDNVQNGAHIPSVSDTGR